MCNISTVFDKGEYYWNENSSAKNHVIEAKARKIGCKVDLNQNNVKKNINDFLDSLNINKEDLNK